MFSLKKWLMKREGVHVGPSIWQDIYPRIFATILVVVIWCWIIGFLLKTADPETVAPIRFWGSVIWGGLIFFGSGNDGFGN
jgi:hypothetical protein